MKQKLMLMNECMMRGKTQEGLHYAKELLSELDPDDDDDLEVLREVLVKGLSKECEEEFVELLVQSRFDFTTTWPKQGGLASVFRDSSCRKPEVFQHLIELGMDPYLADQDGNTIAHCLANLEKNLWNKQMQQQNAQLIRSIDEIDGWLLPNAYGATPLHLAVLRGNYLVLEALLEKGASADVTGTISNNRYSHVICFDQVTPLQLACSMGEEECVKLLLEYGADPAKTDAAGKTPAHYTVQEPNKLYCPFYYSSIPSQEALLEKKCNILCLLKEIDHPDEHGTTPLLYAMEQVSFDRSRFASVLLELGADPKIHNNRGRTPLMEAVLHYNKEAVKAFLSQEVDKNARDNTGNTALHFAVRDTGDSKLARYLLKKGADYLVTNNEGFSAMDLAADRGMNDVLELMLSGEDS